jgi:lipopolysaccharide biosynthesis protein
MFRVNGLNKVARMGLGAPARLVSEFRGLLALLRRRTGYIEDRWPGVDGDELAGRVCVFVHFDRAGEIHDFVLHYLREIREAGFKIIFVSNAPKLKPAAVQRVRSLAAIILRRANVGYDFGGYKDGLSLIPDLARVDLLLLANDSVYGPFRPLTDILSRRGNDAQFWGLTDSWDRAYHLQSYFLLFGRVALAHEAFGRFWKSVRYVNSKGYVIRRYEVGLSRTLMKAGLRGKALFPARTAALAVIESVRNGSLKNENFDDTGKRFLAAIYRALENGAPLNVSHYLWDYLIVEMGYPFVKRELIAKNPVSIPHIARWPEVIGSVSSYDTDLIVRHLELSLKNRFI